MAARMLRRALIPSLILVSSAERTRSTAAIMATACALDATQVQSVHELYLATPDTTWHVLTRCDPAVEHVLICGHNPGLSEIASRFGPSPRHRNLSTAGLATAVWQEGDWATLEPEFSDGCDMDDPEK